MRGLLSLILAAALLPGALGLRRRSSTSSGGVGVASGMLLNGASSVQPPRATAAAPRLRQGQTRARPSAAVPAACDAGPAPWPLPPAGPIVFEDRRDLDGYFIHGAFALLMLLGEFSNVQLSSEDNKHAHSKSVRNLVQICWQPMLVYVTRTVADLFWWKYCTHFRVMYDRPKVCKLTNPVIFLPRGVVKSMSVEDLMGYLAECGCTEVWLAAYGQKSLSFSVLNKAKEKDPDCTMLIDIGFHAAAPEPGGARGLLYGHIKDPSILASNGNGGSAHDKRLSVTTYAKFGDLPSGFHDGTYDMFFLNPRQMDAFKDVYKIKVYQELWHVYNDDAVRWNGFPKSGQTFREFLRVHVPKAINYLRRLCEPRSPLSRLRFETCMNATDYVTADSCAPLFEHHALLMSRLIRRYLAFHVVPLADVILYASAAVRLPRMVKLLGGDKRVLRASMEKRVALGALLEQVGANVGSYLQLNLLSRILAKSLRAEFARAAVHMAALGTAPTTRPGIFAATALLPEGVSLRASNQEAHLLAATASLDRVRAGISGVPQLLSKRGTPLPLAAAQVYTARWQKKNFGAWPRKGAVLAKSRKRARHGPILQAADLPALYRLILASYGQDFRENVRLNL
ncbi:hypothetical protein M885DRAFT_592167 [Pelagophyceae sp. CCMP2097]|nr:hypothetical protein M885DRAFT_592167 [Pelagophyceae sp. CCMP2097]